MSAPPLESSFLYRMATSLNKAWADWFTSVGSSITGLGTMSTQNANSVAITGGSIGGITDLSVSDGGTGASTAAGARSNIGAPSITDFLNHISGFVVSNNGSDANNDVDISAGVCMDSTNVEMIAGAAMTKRLDASWAAGTNNGGLDTGTKAISTEYYIHAILKDADASVDYMFSISRTVPTMPAGYTKFRNVGWCKTDASGNILGFVATENAGGGLTYEWKTPVRDVSILNTLGTTARLDALSVPTGIKVSPLATVFAYDASSPCYVIVSDPDTTDTAPIPGLNTVSATAGARSSSQLRCMTNTSRQIRSRSDISTVDEFYVGTFGFVWSRR